MKLKYFSFCLLLSFLMVACQEDTKGPKTLDTANLSKELQKRLINAKAGDQILLPAGTFEFKRGLSLNDTPDITIKGAGKGKTILSFKGQIEGAQGLLCKKHQ